jgi:hypothetical protein
MRHLLPTFLVLLATASGVSAQPPAPPPDASAASTPAPTGESFLEQKHFRARFEKDGTSERVLKLRAKVLTEQAVRDWGQLPLNYMPDVETLTVTRVRVEKADGSVIADATGSVQDVAVRPPTAMPVFVDLRQKVIAVASLRPGDVVEIEAKWTVHKALAANHHWFEYSFVTEGGTVLDERLELDVPVDANAIARSIVGRANTKRRLRRGQKPSPSSATSPQPTCDSPRSRSGMTSRPGMPASRRCPPTPTSPPRRWS